APEERQVGGDTGRTVSVILPTVDRYSYLEPLLQQLAAQTIAPHQVIVADQTPLDHRRHDLASVAPSLPLSVIELGEPGQCTSRNAAIAAATGEFLLFIDDDDDVPVDLIEGHLSRMIDGVDASSGAVDDATAGPPPVGFRHRRASDVFPTNNTLLRRSALVPTGLFDPAYDRGARADHDLGMRLHLSGAQLVYDPSIEVFHHHAPVGGLRTHGARKVTRAGSRRSLTQRHLPSLTERYLAHRYFRPDQASEGLAISALSQLGGDGRRWCRVGRAAVQLVLMPFTVRALRSVDRDARALLTRRPPIPDLPPLMSEPADR
ncbi:MAG TPA: glycosyltransferase, partial [Microthrixaceae bacterium]|nr:glycosyltransferase [Microthrixaceae bacterium]